VKRVIALQGVGKMGKSQTIRTVDELLRTKYPSARVGHEHRTKVELRVVSPLSTLFRAMRSSGVNSERKLLLTSRC
jgi:hypothetical protein